VPKPTPSNLPRLPPRNINPNYTAGQKNVRRRHRERKISRRKLEIKKRRNQRAEIEVKVRKAGEKIEADVKKGKDGRGEREKGRRM
jgi:hypothetical protein